ncbi:hypothetical protein KI387_020203, partial [Taxus chinensis]
VRGRHAQGVGSRSVDSARGPGVQVRRLCAGRGYNGAQGGDRVQGGRQGRAVCPRGGRSIRGGQQGGVVCLRGGGGGGADLSGGGSAGVAGGLQGFWGRGAGQIGFGLR